MDKKFEKALVVLSGGQDSTTCLYVAKKEAERVYAISFDYGQRHRIELEAAKQIAALAEVPHEVIDAKFINALSPNALTRAEIAIDCPEGKLPTTFVDGRNMFFLGMAAVYAKQLGISAIYTGTCQTDYSGYPDCRQEFIDAMECTVELAMEHPFIIRTPLMFLTKAQSVELAMSLPGCMEALALSHTCYEGQFPPCGKCPACALRAKGFAEAGVEDPILRRARGE